jgi:hypothetical protein
MRLQRSERLESTLRKGSDVPQCTHMPWRLGKFKSPLAHQYDPRPDLGLYGIRGRFRGPVVAPLWHRLSSEALAWHGLNGRDAPTAA